MRRVVNVCVLTAMVWCAGIAPTGVARADRGADGMYGRFDGDFTLSLGLGGGIATARHADATGALWGDLRARYLDTAGFFLTPEWRPEAGDGLVSFGADVRPLFPALFLLAASPESEWLDLLVGSLGIDLGVALLPLGHGTRGALSVGFGVDVPLLLPQTVAHGVFLRLSARHLYGGAGDAGGRVSGIAEWSFGATLTIRMTHDTGLAAWERSGD